MCKEAMHRVHILFILLAPIGILLAASKHYK
nr:MAG TPA: hypothetical protein [Caudoviricetes sp.]